MGLFSRKKHENYSSEEESGLTRDASHSASTPSRDASAGGEQPDSRAQTESSSVSPQSDASDISSDIAVAPVVSNEPVSPLTIERLENFFQRHEWSYDRVENVMIRSGFERIPFTFVLRGEKHEILSVLGALPLEIPDESESNLQLFIDEWHSMYLWPKVYKHRDDEGILRLHSEVNVDYEKGLTDAQLDMHFRTAIATTHQVFSEAVTRLGLPSFEEKE